MAKRKIIIGDIHGCFDELQELLDKVAATKSDTIIAVGDVLDRGPMPRQVFSFFHNNKSTRVIMGNHERKHVSGELSKSQEQTRLQLGDSYPETVEWMKELPYFIEDNDMIVVHAALQPGVSMQDQQENILCGTMAGEWKLKQLLSVKNWFEEYHGEKAVVFGHKVVGKTPFIYNDTIFGIDTGCCHGGFLSAVTVPDFKIYSVKARHNYWSFIKHGKKIR